MTDANMEADIAIVGGGLAGLTAGVVAAQRGAKVVVLERGTDERYACNSRFAGGAFHVAYTNPEDDPADLRAAIDRITKGEAQADLATAVAQNAGRTVRWLRDQGVAFEPGNAPMYQWMAAPHRPMLAGFDWPDHGPDRILKTLTVKLQESGGTLRRGCEALELVMEGGICTGLRVRDGGTPAVILSKVVLLADGGFQGNAEMVGRYITKHPDKLFQRSAGTAMGDGIRMAEAAGAALVNMERFYGHFLSRDVMTGAHLSPYPQVDPIAAAAIVVDGSGRRFADEGLGGIYMTNVVARFDDPLSAWTIFDRRIWEEGPGVKSVYPANPTVEKAGGKVYRADSPAELAHQIGIDAATLTRTVETYNAALCGDNRASIDIPRSDGAVPATPLAVRPLMAIPLVVGITNTMGGIAIEGRMRVKRADGAIIPGLLAAGGTTGGLEGGGNVGYVGGLIKAAVTGLLAGENAL